MNGSGRRDNLPTRRNDIGSMPNENRIRGGTETNHDSRVFDLSFPIEVVPLRPWKSSRPQAANTSGQIQLHQEWIEGRG